MKRITALFLSLALVLSAAPAALAEDSGNSDITGGIKATLRFDYPQLLTNVQEKNINVTLYDADGEKKANIPLDGEASGDMSENATAVKKNIDGVALTTESEIGYFEVDFSSIPIGDYRLEFTGDGYIPCTTPLIKLDDYSQQIIVGTGDKTFSIGDVDGNGTVNKTDRDLISDALGKADEESLSRYDLNGDKKIDIIDLAYVNHQLVSDGGVQIFDTALIAKKVVNTDAISDSVEVLDGNISDMFEENNTAPVTLNVKDGSDELEIPIELNKAAEMEQIEIISPDSDGALIAGVATVTYEENGQDVTEEIPFDYSAPDDVMFISSVEGTSSVVISLGKRVAVKKVIINVTKVEGIDGTPTYAVVQEVKFLKDIVPENPSAQSLTVKNVKASPKNESVELRWDTFPNISGYKIYYGEQSNALTSELVSDKTSVVVDGLKNLKTYYFAVAPISDGWEGGLSEIISAMPIPSSAPLKPDMITVSPMDGALSLSWKKTENATYYKVFYKEASAPDSEYIQSGGKISDTKHSIGGLTNDTEYLLYIIAGNDIGESPKSDITSGTPKKVAVEAPKIPTLNRMDVSNIESIEMRDKSNVDRLQTPNFDVWQTVDGDYSTYWMPLLWSRESVFTYTFKEATEMNYFVFVPRLDEAKYYNAIGKYSIRVTDENGQEKQLYTKASVSGKNKYENYFIFEFEKTKVKKLLIDIRMSDGAAAVHSMSEVAFYEADNLADDVRELFANDTYTELSPEAKADPTAAREKIAALRAQATDADGYYVDKNILLDELSLAEAILDNDSSKLGITIDGIESRSGGADSAKYSQTASDLQPLGAVAYSTAYAEKNNFNDTQVTVYAHIPEGETVSLVATQFYAEANSWQSSAIGLQSGRNVITVPQMGSQTSERGGALYVRYSGSKPQEISLQIRLGATAIPYLELADWYDLSVSERQSRIADYVDALEAHCKAYKLTQTGIYNSTEISMPNVLLSVPADRVLSGIKPTGADNAAAAQTLYDNVLAWEDIMHVVNTTQGIDNTYENSDMQTRQNIRYMRMFGNAFMYAAGSHIGIGYGSVSGVVCGKPVSALSEGASANSLFGWGIAHEIGHNMDKLGKAETTNNIYSLMAQTYDRKQNTLTSRLEAANKYADIYDKVSLGYPGASNDVFTQLGMYWQLHLAYDDGDNPMDFYNRLFKEWKSGNITASSYDDKFAIAASKTANRNLTEFFESWGMRLSADTKETLKSFPAETRKIQYLTDESRRYRLNGGQAAEGTTTATPVLDSENEKQININFSTDANVSSILGWEILRNGKSIAFVANNRNTDLAKPAIGSYADIIGSANNKAFTYSVQAIDMLGNKVGAPSDEKQARIAYVNTVDPSSYTVTNENGVMKAVMKEQTAVSGIKITNAPSSGSYTVSVTREETDENNQTTSVTVTAKNGSFAVNETPDADYYVSYFNKPGTDASDTRIWTYDAKEITVSGVPESATVEFISYAGDNIEFNQDAVIGHLASDYVYGDGEDEVIKAGTLIITGSYRGDPVYNTVQINGKFVSTNSEGEQVVTERAIDGYSLLFAEIPADGEVSDISDGLFIFVPNTQKEAELQGSESGCAVESLLPAQIKAELYRTDTAESTASKRVTSDTIWIDSPSDGSMPTIVLE